MRENITALLLLYVRPVAAISRILDHGRLWFAIVAALLIAVAVHVADPTPMMEAGTKAAAQVQLAREDPGAIQPVLASHYVADAAARLASYDASSFFSALFAIAIGMVPAMIVMRAVTGYGSFSVLMRRDYLSLLM